MSWLRRSGAGIVCLALLGLVGGSAVGVRPGAPAAPTGAAAAPTPPPPEAPSPPPPVLAAAVAGPAQTAAGVARMLAGPLADPRLGGRVTASVVDAETGEVLLDRSADTYVIPASTAKLVTAVTALAAGEPDRTLSTRLVAGARSGEVVLVGGGDGTLSAARGGQPVTYEGAPRLATLAARARKAGLATVTRVVVDGSLFAGPRLAPGWDPVDVAGGYVAPITAVMVDGGRQGPGIRARSAEPDLATGRALAAALGAPAAPVV
ncbi:MAG TPA: D-alanyl-D-alanine carboxypeptidase, partial [Mycobacteriales bacterium]|nr:D-alanyl-D-alanine carboxypeptidase [Mycobacteriales bacterium]